MVYDVDFVSAVGKEKIKHSLCEATSDKFFFCGQ